jgi:hypothetical protein
MGLPQEGMFLARMKPTLPLFPAQGLTEVPNPSTSKDNDKRCETRLCKEEKYVRNARVIVIVGAACAAAVGAAINIFRSSERQGHL